MDNTKRLSAAVCEDACFFVENHVLLDAQYVDIGSFSTRKEEFALLWVGSIGLRVESDSIWRPVILATNHEKHWVQLFF